MSQPTPPPFAAPAAAAPHTTVAHTETGQPLPPSEGSTQYQNNPFFVAIDGIRSLFEFAKPVAIILLVLSVVFGLLNLGSSIFDATESMNSASSDAQVGSIGAESASLPELTMDMTPETIGMIAIIGFFVFVVTVLLLVIGAIFTGLGAIAAAASVNRKPVTAKEAFSTLLKRFPGYLGLIVLVAIKTLLWSLLFIVPGIIMSVRYSLASTAFFARDMKITEAINYSTKITKGGWMTLFASSAVLNILTLGLLQSLIQPGVQAVIFRQYDQLEQSQTAKPGAHWLSITVTVLASLLILGSVFVLLAGGALLLFAVTQ